MNKKNDKVDFTFAVFLIYQFELKSDLLFNF